MTRIFFFLIGFGLMVIGWTYIILYMNLMSVGYNWIDYVNYIIKRIECYYSVIGLIIIILTFLIKGEKIYELHI